jgi:hypothetical protein
MPVKLLTPPLASSLAELALNGRIETLHIDRREHGKQKGKFFVEFTQSKEENITFDNRNDRAFAHSILESAADDLAEGVKIDNFIMEKKDSDSPYIVQYVARRGEK